MPKVEVSADVDALFADARADALSENPRQIVIVTPGRMRLCFPAAIPGSIPKDAEDNTRSILGGDRPLAVSVVAYTKPAALMNEYENNVESLNRCIPFFGHLLGFVYVGHSVVVFEGHPSA